MTGAGLGDMMEAGLGAWGDRKSDENGVFTELEDMDGVEKPTDMGEVSRGNSSREDNARSCCFVTGILGEANTKFPDDVTVCVTGREDG